MANQPNTVAGEEHRTLWQPPEKREKLSEEAKQWLEENAEAFESWRKYIEENGLPLAEYRPF